MEKTTLKQHWLEIMRLCQGSCEKRRVRWFLPFTTDSSFLKDFIILLW